MLKYIFETWRTRLRIIKWLVNFSKTYFLNIDYILKYIVDFFLNIEKIWRTRLRIIKNGW